MGGVGSGLEFTQLWRGLHPGKSQWSGPRDIGDPSPFSGDPEKGMADPAMVPHIGEVEGSSSSDWKDAVAGGGRR